MSGKISPSIVITLAFGALLVLWPLAARQNNQDDNGRIVGRVIERDTGQPLAAELGVAMRGARGITLRHVRASEDGVFELTGLPAADVQLNTKLDGYAVERRSLSLGEGEVRQVEFHLIKLVRLRGRVLDEAGEPAADALIRVDYAREAAADGAIAATYQWESGETRSDAQGAYFIAVHPEKAFTLDVSHAKFQPMRRTVDPAADRAPVVLRLKPRQQDER
jgi:hypothetical protein